MKALRPTLLICTAALLFGACAGDESVTPPADATDASPDGHERPPKDASNNDSTVVEPLAPGTHKDILFATVEGIALEGDLYLPASPRGLVIVVHGGAFFMGDKGDQSYIAEFFAGENVAAFAINYRLNGDGAVFPKMPQDILCAVAYVRDNAASIGFDPQRIALTGTSSGGHLVAIAALIGQIPSYRPSCAGATDLTLAGVIPGFGPHDWAFREKEEGVAEPEMDYLGGSFADKPMVYEEASPVSHVSEATGPFFIYHGADDTTIPPKQSQLLHDALENAGKSSTLLIVPGAAHGFSIKPSAEQTLLFDALKPFIDTIFAP